jgi:hypothetical protein
MRCALSCGLVLVAAAVGAQVKTVQTPPPPPAFASYGPPEPVALSLIAYNGQQYHRTNVSTTGELRALGTSLSYFVLADGTARVLLIPALDSERAASQLLGRRIELTGVVRVLPVKQDTVPCRAQLVLESQCEDPELPVLPDTRVDWPPVSITFFSMSDVGTGEGRAPGRGGLSLAALATDASAHVGKTVTVVGLFAGRNLFGDLPAGSERSPTDWVLKLGSHAVWVTGKKPEGKGFRLDPDYRSDTARWLQVTGRVETVGGVTFLRATKVALTTAPKADDDEP